MLIGFAIGILIGGSVSRGDEAAFFESRIRPLLVTRCYECHSGSTRQSGGLALDSRPGWELGGDSGPAIVPGDPEASRLIQAVRWKDPSLQMPPADAGGKLAASEIRDLEAWIQSGAFDPREEAPPRQPAKTWDETFEERRNWWSLHAVRNPAIPVAEDAEWNQSSIDRFLRDRISEEQLNPAPVAGPETLIRRATLILTGLPPQMESVSEFVAESQIDREAAYERLIDRLLASPQFGERFARHWMDVVRFTETHGNEWNYDVPYAWRYRDYLIRGFNNDVPYDQIIREHIAGDLLAEPRMSEDGRLNESVIGTAFYRFGEVNHDSCVLFRSIGYDIADNQIDTLTKAFQATTVACARCHDHKMDAVSARDYHAMLGILRSSRAVMQSLDGARVNESALSELRTLKDDIRRELATVWHRDAVTLDANRLNALLSAEAPPAVSDPLFAWSRVVHTNASETTASESGTSHPAETPIATAWLQAAQEYAAESGQRATFNSAHFTTLADFTSGKPGDWSATGMGLRDIDTKAGDFTVTHEGEAAIGRVLPSGIYTFGLSDKLNGAIRSPDLQRTHGKVSFEVTGGGFSLTRLVFNNCQLDYTNQHSLHHPEWSWVTVPFQEDTDSLHPYAELLTFWDNPKFPDPLGTLSKDVENQRLPFSEHSKNPRTWWGVRRVVTHDTADVPKDEAMFIARLFTVGTPQTLNDASARYSQIAAAAVDAFATRTATDDDTRWLDWLLKKGILTNQKDASARIGELVTAYREIEATQLSLPATVPGMAEEGPGFDQPLLVRGDSTRPGDSVERRYPEALQPLILAPQAIHRAERYRQSSLVTPAKTAGRAMIAEAIANADNPLTARVMVNRLWQWVFGNGLVRTPDNFGHVGELPSHPELLDHLAGQFVQERWSMKRMIRSMVLSRAFQSSGTAPPMSRERDPDNILLSWYPARRAEAEIIRDSLLAVSGRLDPTQFGASVHPYRETADTEKRLYTGPLDGDGRRSLYIKFQLMEPPSFLSAFNLPGGKETQGRRDASNVPAQSLALLNDPLVLAMADFWADRLVADTSTTTVAARVERMFRRALGRSPRHDESVRFVKGIETLASMHAVPPESLLTSKAVWKDAAHTMFNFKEFIFIP